ncbi:hypothetical protein M426DRAFT_11150 [Hypoxylon sp. CI-4A]|nr:hypothetical protein M426DRAFT_11150 [Hypoxylon sp. CI-4A]
MADNRTLRIVTVATFLPAFPLCLAHGVISSRATPSVGLVPLAFSAIAGILLSRQSTERQAPYDTERGNTVEEGEQQEQEQEQEQRPEEHEEEDLEVVQHHQEAPGSLTLKPTRSHPILVFAIDSVLSAALMVVLVFTWIDSSEGSTSSAESAMLAAYSTVPILINFFVHIYLAVCELFRGLAITGLTQYLAWQVVPPDCPDCGRRLRPYAPPRMPWVDEISFPRPNFDRVKFRIPTIPNVKVPKWKAPAWLRGRTTRGYVGLLGSANDDETIRSTVTIPYRDDPEEGEPSTRPPEPETEPETVEPVVDIVGKRSRKLGRNSSSSS